MSFEKTRALIAEMLERQVIPGVDYTLIRHGKIEYAVTQGTEAGIPDAPRLVEGRYFDLASLTKVIGTVPLILRLAAEKQLELDGSVSTYLPEIKDSRVTIRHLLTHTSGVTAWIDHRDDLSASQLREAIYAQVSFGTKFNQEIEYNDYNYLLLGFIAEKITHLPVQKAIQQLVLMPWQLTQSTFNPDPFQTVPTGIRDGVLLRGQVHDPKAASLGAHAASAGLFATKADVVKFTQKMLAPQNELFGINQQQDFLNNQTANPALQRSWGWAFVCHNADQVVLRHSGFTGTFILWDRMTQNALVLLSNRLYPEPNLEFLDYRQQIYQTFAAEDKLK
ncbi:serine hydrolase domain-containing protein [Pediococcus acidilactici]|uniref:serine hydrolase domain-containing protein n=1 Tax=Pediococcus acidilactici TaxID=1254 RepID=UPI001154DDDF|nr:serine hydrolase domain-containing protein [Pediococcus acidilactici]QDJ23428.1 serine hydrolase [Pediococcus acidilactici]